MKKSFVEGFGKVFAPRSGFGTLSLNADVRELHPILHRTLVLRQRHCATDDRLFLPKTYPAMNKKKRPMQAGDPVTLDEFLREHVRLVLARKPDLNAASATLGWSLLELQIWCKRLKLMREWKRVAAFRAELKKASRGSKRGGKG